MIEADGIARFSMRRLAARLDVTVGALYWHFGNVDEIFLAVAQRLFQSFDTSIDPDETWDDAARRMLTSVWTTAWRHPVLLALQQTQPMRAGPGQPILRSLLLVLRDAGFPADVAVDHARSLLWMTFGFIRSTDATMRRLGLPPPTAAQSPAHVELDLAPLGEAADDMGPFLARLDTLDVDELFHRTLDLLLGGIAADARRWNHGP